MRSYTERCFVVMSNAKLNLVLDKGVVDHTKCQWVGNKSFQEKVQTLTLEFHLTLRVFEVLEEVPGCPNKRQREGHDHVHNIAADALNAFEPPLQNLHFEHRLMLHTRRHKMFSVECLLLVDVVRLNPTALFRRIFVHFMVKTIALLLDGVHVVHCLGKERRNKGDTIEVLHLGECCESCLDAVEFGVSNIEIDTDGPDIDEQPKQF